MTEAIFLPGYNIEDDETRAEVMKVIFPPGKTEQALLLYTVATGLTRETASRISQIMSACPEQDIVIRIQRPPFEAPMLPTRKRDD